MGQRSMKRLWRQKVGTVARAARSWPAHLDKETSSGAAPGAHPDGHTRAALLGCTATGADVAGWALGALIGGGVTGEACVLDASDGATHGACAAVAPCGEIAIDHARALATLVDRPHDQRLAAAGIAGREHPLHGARVGARVLDVAARVSFHAELVQQLGLGAEKAHREQHQLSGELAFGPGDGAERRLGLGARHLQGRNASIAVVAEAGRDDRVVLLAHVGLLRLFHGVAEPVLQRPLGPRRELVGAPLPRWPLNSRRRYAMEG